MTDWRRDLSRGLLVLVVICALLFSLWRIAGMGADAQSLVHVSVRSASSVTLRNPNGREWTQAPGPSGYVVFSVPYQAGEWGLRAGNQRIAGPGRWDEGVLWITLPPMGSVGGYTVDENGQTAPPTPLPSLMETRTVAPTMTIYPSPTTERVTATVPAPHDPLWGINLPPAPEGHVWVLMVIERPDGHRMVASKELVAVEDLIVFLEVGS